MWNSLSRGSPASGDSWKMDAGTFMFCHSNWCVIEVAHQPLVRDPCMHRGTCVTHVPWCIQGLLSRGKNIPSIPGARATRNFTYLVRGPWTHCLHCWGKICYWYTPLTMNRWNRATIFSLPLAWESLRTNRWVASDLRRHGATTSNCCIIRKQFKNLN